MSEQIIILPADAANVGKKIRTRERTIGANVIQEHFFIKQRQYLLDGSFYVHSGLLAVQAAADVFPAGRLFIENPVANTKIIGIRTMEYNFSAVAATVSITAPRITLKKFTFTGVASGAALADAPAKVDESAAAASFNIRTANTGMTMTGVGVVCGITSPAILTAAGYFGISGEHKWDEEDGILLLRPGQGAVVTQPDAGTAADPRRFELDFLIEQYTAIAV